MKDKQILWIEATQAKNPEIAPLLHELGSLYDRKLWHQLTIKLEEALEVPELQGSLTVDLYKHFITGFVQRLNSLKLAKIAVVVSKQISINSDAAAFLEEVAKQLKDTKQRRLEQPLLYIVLQIAQYKLQAGDLDSCKKTIEEGKEELDSLSDVDPTVSAAYYYTRSLFFKHQKDFAEFYKSSLLYLAFISSDALPNDVKLSLAVDISLAALLGSDVYNFGELLLHPIINVLDGTPYGWLHEMLACFNRGDMHQYEQLCAQYADVLNDLPAMVENERNLREKITILCLTELIFNLPADQRTIPLSTIAERTKLSIDGVEFLLMKTLALNLIKGIIDEVEQTVQVSWVQPRVLTIPQVISLNGRLGAWISKVNAATETLEAESIATAA